MPSAQTAADTSASGTNAPEPDYVLDRQGNTWYRNLDGTYGFVVRRTLDAIKTAIGIADTQVIPSVGAVRVALAAVDPDLVRSVMPANTDLHGPGAVFVQLNGVGSHHAVTTALRTNGFTWDDSHDTFVVVNPKPAPAPSATPVAATLRTIADWLDHHQLPDAHLYPGATPTSTTYVHADTLTDLATYAHAAGALDTTQVRICGNGHAQLRLTIDGHIDTLRCTVMVTVPSLPGLSISTPPPGTTFKRRTVTFADLAEDLAIETEKDAEL